MMISLWINNNSYVIEEEIDKTIKGFDEFNLDILDDPTIEVLLSRCSQAPLFAKKRLVVVKGIEQINSKQLVSYLSDLPHTTDLILVLASLKKSDKLWKTAGQMGTIRQFEPLSDGQIRKFAQKKAEDFSVTFEPEALSLFLYLTNNDQRVICNELAKLEGQIVSVTDVNKRTSRIRKVVVFDLITHILNKNMEQAFIGIEQFLEDGEDISFLTAMLLRQFKLSVQVKHLMGRGFRKVKIAKLLKAHPYAIQQTMKQCRKFSSQALLRIFIELEKLSYEIKMNKHTKPNVIVHIIGKELR